MHASHVKHPNANPVRIPAHASRASHLNARRAKVIATQTAIALVLLQER